MCISDVKMFESVLPLYMGWSQHILSPVDRENYCDDMTKLYQKKMIRRLLIYKVASKDKKGLCTWVSTEFCLERKKFNNLKN